MEKTKLSAHVSWQKLIGEDYAYAFHSRTGEYYEFEGVAYEIWIMLAEGISVDQISDNLIGKYSETNPTSIKNDVREFLDDLQLLGLINLNKI